MNDKTLAAEPEPAARQFQGRDGVWHNFIDERHFQNTVEDGSWPIRNLYSQEAIDNLLAQLAEAQDALQAAQRLFKEALPKFNWGASFLDANAIQLLNEVPAKVNAAIEVTKGDSNDN